MSNPASSIGDLVTNHSPLYDKHTAAEQLRVSVRSLENLMARRSIAFRKIGGLVRFTHEDINALIEKTRVAPLDELMLPRRRKPVEAK